MKKKQERNNALTKRKGILRVLRKEGISRINKHSLDEIENFIEGEIENLARLLKELLTIRGKKTLTTEEVKQSVKKLKEKKHENYEV